jgi:hypothetical protein
VVDHELVIGWTLHGQGTHSGSLAGCNR